MRKILVFSLFLGLLFACEKIDKYAQFSVQTKTTFEVPADMVVQTPIVLDAQTLDVDTKVFEDFNTSAYLIDKATIKDIKLIIINPQNVNFNFLTDVELYIKTNNLPEIRIAWLNNIGNINTQSLNLEHLPDNLSEYLKSEQVKINLVLLNDEVLTQPVQVEVNASFNIKAEVLGK